MIFYCELYSFYKWRKIRFLSLARILYTVYSFVTKFFSFHSWNKNSIDLRGIVQLFVFLPFFNSMYATGGNEMWYFHLEFSVTSYNYANNQNLHININSHSCRTWWWRKKKKRLYQISEKSEEGLTIDVFLFPTFK